MTHRACHHRHQKTVDGPSPKDCGVAGGKGKLISPSLCKAVGQGDPCPQRKLTRMAFRVPKPPMFRWGSQPVNLERPCQLRSDQGAMRRPQRARWRPILGTPKTCGLQRFSWRIRNL